ncbi:MAG: hypothetical protein U0T83_07340 [Bacteriovoracaceae bacterium]
MLKESANFRQCCRSPDGKSLTEGIDPHDKSHSCGKIVDPPPTTSKEERCQIPVIKVPMPDWMCGGLKKIIPLIAGNVATFMIFTCISAAVPSGWLYWLSMAGSMVNEIVNQFAYQDETRDVLKGTENVNDALEHYKKLEQQLEVNMDNAKRKLDNYRAVMIAMLAAEVSAGVEAIILTIAAIAASSTAAATPFMEWLAPFNMGWPYNPLGIVFPTMPMSYFILYRPEVTNTGIFSPGVITYPYMGNPFIWLQCSVLPPPSPPEESTVQGKDLTRAETLKKLDGLCKVATTGANGAATSCAPTAAGEAAGVDGGQCSVTKTCKGAAYATLQCSGHSDAVVKQLTGGSKTYCGGGGCPPNLPGPPVKVAAPPVQGPPASSTGYSAGVVDLTDMGNDDSGLFMDKFKNIFEKYEDSFIFKYLKNNSDLNKFVDKLKIQDALAKFGFWDGVGLVSTILVSVILTLCLSYFQIYPRVVWDPYLRLAFYTFFTLLMSVIYNEYEVIYHDAERDYEQMKHIREEFERKVKAANPVESRYCPKKNYFEWLDLNLAAKKSVACGSQMNLRDFWMNIAFAAEDESKKVVKLKKPLKNVPCFTTKDNMLNTDASCSCIANNSCAKFPNPPKLDFDKIEFYKKNSDAKNMLKDIMNTETNALNLMAGGKYEEGFQNFQSITKYKR